MFQGVSTALVTPFRDGALDERALQELVEIQISAGVQGLVPCGSTGESATLSHEEHRRVVEIVVKQSRGRVPVIAGTGSNSTQEAIALTLHAKAAGADAALLISPYYNKPTQHGIVLHYAAIAEKTKLPLIVYNIPGRTASNILPETMQRLATIENVVAVKEASGNLDQMAHVLALCPKKFTVLSGDDSLTLPLLALGGGGVISTSSNLVPSEMVEMWRAFEKGDVARARQIHFQLLPVFDVLFCETNPIPIKAALELRGLITKEIRLPLTPLTPANRERLQSVLQEAGLR